MASALCSAMPSASRSSSGVKRCTSFSHSTEKPPISSSFQWIGWISIDLWATVWATGMSLHPSAWLSDDAIATLPLRSSVITAASSFSRAASGVPRMSLGM